MHEFSICEGILNIAQEAVMSQPEQPIKVTVVRVVAGRLHQIVEDNLQFAFEVLTENTLFAGAKLEFISIPIKVKCRSCDYETVVTNNYFTCGNCDSTSIEIIEGKELYVKDVEVED